MSHPSVAVFCIISSKLKHRRNITLVIQNLKRNFFFFLTNTSCPHDFAFQGKKSHAYSLTQYYITVNESQIQNKGWYVEYNRAKWCFVSSPCWYILLASCWRVKSVVWNETRSGRRAWPTWSIWRMSCCSSSSCDRAVRGRHFCLSFTQCCS